MKKRNYKGRCEKRTIPKCKDVCRTYDPIQYVYSEMLSQDESIEEFQCNVPMDGLEDGDYTSDFVCKKTDGSMMVRECVYRQHLTKPMTVRLLEASRRYWFEKGIADWGIVINEEK